MNGYNRGILIGRLGADPEIKQSVNGKSFCVVHIATNKSVKKGDSYESVAQWNSIWIWAKQAEYICKYGAKGGLVFVEYTVETRGELREGLKMYRTYLTAKSVQILSGGRDSKPEINNQTTSEREVFDETDIPF